MTAPALIVARRSRTRRATAAILLLLAATSPSTGRDAPKGRAPAPAPGEVPPAVRLGVRAETVRRQTPVIRTIVLVPDERSYVAAIAQWKPLGRFPVLIDDGTPATRENLARFIRAARAQWAKPRPAEEAAAGAKPSAVRIVRWSGGAALPEDRAARQAALERAVASAWVAPEGGTLIKTLTEAGLAPPGVVAADVTDPAWTAALALAAGHGQPLVWVAKPEGFPLSGTMPLSEADRLSAAITAACEQLAGVTWKGLGDDIDALTICLNAPTRVLYGAGDEPKLAATPGFQAKPNESFAATDVYGRHARGDRTDRWAWAGQVFGTGPEAAYRAMCGLFLQPDAAWFFHGYQSGPPWDTFSPADAARELTAAGWSVRSDGPPRQSATNFRDAASGAWATRGRDKPGSDVRGGTWAGLIGVNTSGNADFFDLKPGRALAADAPVLGWPALMVFVHSWSAQQPGQAGTIAGRAFRNGVYAYVGSVHEPYLHAFQPTGRLVLRMLSPAPLGAAARLDAAPMWRVNILADPLITLGPPADTSERELPMDGVTPLEDELRAQLAAKDLGAAAGTLALLDRDADAVRLARAVMDDAEHKPTVELALAALGPAFRRVEFDLFLRVAELALTRADEQPWVRDLIWHALWPTITQLPEAGVNLLTRAVRPDCAARDAEEAGRAVRRLHGPEAERAFLDGLIARTTDAGVRKEIEQVRTSAAAAAGK